MDMSGKGNETKVLGTTISWSEMGQGYPLILIHGLLDSNRTWRRSAPLLARHFRVLMPDLPGYGLSGRPDAPYTLKWFAEIMAAWMKEIGIEKAHICGHSFGGGIAQWMLLEQRECIDRLALLSAGGLGRNVSLGLRFAAFPVFGKIISPFVVSYGIPVIARYMPGVFGHMEPGEADQYIKMIRSPGTQRAFQRTLEGVINFFGQHMQTGQRSGEVEDMPPIAIFWGQNDPILPISHGIRAVKRSEGITLTTYKRCGHFPHLEFPDRFSRDLVEFLNNPDRKPANIHKSQDSSWLEYLSSIFSNG